jgi:hypothetical protein
MKPTIPKRELKVLIKRFLSDSDRGISQELFADLCGITRNHLLDVLIYKT